MLFTQAASCRVTTVSLICFAVVWSGQVQYTMSVVGVGSDMGALVVRGVLAYYAAFRLPKELGNMDFLISTAHAQQAGAAAPNPIVQLLPLIGLIVLFYFMLIRPQMKRNKEHKQLIASLSKGEEVITAGGLTGSVTDLGDEYVKLQIADGVVITVQRQSVSSVLPKGSLKSI